MAGNSNNTNSSNRGGKPSKGGGKGASKRRVTIMDVAKEAGVSIAAVSRILNNSYDGFSAREETKQRVYAAVKKLGYTPSRAAVRLATGKHQAVALCYPIHGHDDVPINTSSVTATLLQLDQMLQIHGAIRSASKVGYDLVLMTRSEERTIGKLLANAGESVDGIIYVNPEDDDTVSEQLRNSELPIAVVGSMNYKEDERICSVSVDEFTAGRMAMGHLIVAGARKVIVAVPEERSHEAAIVDRVEGIAHAVNSYSDPSLSFTVVNLPEDMEQAKAAFLNHIGAWGDPDGVLTLGGVLPFAISKALEVERLRIPAQVKLVGFDENPMYALHNPPITGIRYPVEEMCRRATEMLIERIRTGKTPEPALMTPKMIARKSSEASEVPMFR
ncbi:MAG: LacI family DNA-binding transcriptional regulator [Sumerlaeia bacterium]